MAINPANLSYSGGQLGTFPITPGQEFPASVNGIAWAARQMWCDTGGSLAFTDVSGASRTVTVQQGLIPFSALAVASFSGSGLKGYV